MGQVKTATMNKVDPHHKLACGSNPSPHCNMLVPEGGGEVDQTWNFAYFIHMFNVNFVVLNIQLLSKSGNVLLTIFICSC